MFGGICVDEMKTLQYAYFALHNWLFLRAQESVYKTACTAQLPAMLLPVRNTHTQQTVAKYCTPGISLFEQRQHLVN